MPKQSKASTEDKKKGIRTTIYFSPSDLDLVDFLEDQKEATNKIVIKLLRNYKESLDEDKEIKNQDIFKETMNIKNQLQEMQTKINNDFLELQKMLYYRPINVSIPTHVNRSIESSEEESRDSLKYNVDLKDKDIDSFA